MDNGCLAFNEDTCEYEKSITVAFWICMEGGKRILSTASYTVSDQGPGILIEYDSKKEILTVSFTSREKHWQTHVVLPKYSWCHVTATWTDEDSNEKRGLRVVVDGKVNSNGTIGEDFVGKARKNAIKKLVNFFCQ